MPGILPENAYCEDPGSDFFCSNEAELTGYLNYAERKIDVIRKGGSRIRIVVIDRVDESELFST